MNSTMQTLLNNVGNAQSQRQRLIGVGMPPDAEPFGEMRDIRKLDDAEQDRVAEVQAVCCRTADDGSEEDDR